MSNEQISELERLLREATARPWVRDGHIVSRPRNSKVLPGQWLVETKYIADAALVDHLVNNAESYVANAKRVEVLERLLRFTEFKAHNQVCHFCRESSWHGHAADCELAQALKGE